MIGDYTPIPHPHWPEEKEKTRFQCMATKVFYYDFKALLQALRGGTLKFINATNNFGHFLLKKNCLLYPKHKSCLHFRMVK